MGVMELWLGQSPPGFSTNWPRTKPQTQPLGGKEHVTLKATCMFAATLTANGHTAFQLAGALHVLPVWGQRLREVPTWKLILVP